MSLTVHRCVFRKPAQAIAIIVPDALVSRSKKLVNNQIFQPLFAQLCMPSEPASPKSDPALKGKRI
jgi:hypothetical protein